MPDSTDRAARLAEIRDGLASGVGLGHRPARYLLDTIDDLLKEQCETTAILAGIRSNRAEERVLLERSIALKSPEGVWLTLTGEALLRSLALGDPIDDEARRQSENALIGAALREHWPVVKRCMAFLGLSYATTPGHERKGDEIRTAMEAIEPFLEPAQAQESVSA